MTVFNLDNLNPGKWYEMEGGGEICLRVCAGDDYKAIRKQTVRRKVEWKMGTRVEYDITDDEKQSELLWDFSIVDWKNIFDANKVEIPCNKENKKLLMGKSLFFSKFVSDKLSEMTEELAEVKEEEEKN